MSFVIKYWPTFLMDLTLMPTSNKSFELYVANAFHTYHLFGYSIAARVCIIILNTMNMDCCSNTGNVDKIKQLAITTIFTSQLGKPTMRTPPSLSINDHEASFSERFSEHVNVKCMHTCRETVENKVQRKTLYSYIQRSKSYYTITTATTAVSTAKLNVLKTK